MAQGAARPVTDMGATSRNRGARGEVEVVKFYQAAGFNCRRNFMSGAFGGADITGDGMLDMPEVKFVEQVKFWQFVQQAREGSLSGFGLPILWALWIRRNRETWTVTIDARRYLQLLVCERDTLERERSEVPA